MNSFRPGPLPAGVTVHRPAWPKLDGSPASLVPLAVPGGAPTPAQPSPGMTTSDDVLNEARLQAAQILQDAAAEAEMAQEEAQRQGYEDGHQDGLSAAQEELAAMRHEAEAALGAARQQADLVRQACEAEVRAKLADAEARAQAIMTKARDEAAALLEAARTERLQRLEEAQSAVVELAVTAAVRLVQGHLALQPSAVIAMVAAGIRRLKDTDCNVRVSPQDLPLLEAQRSTLERELGAGLLKLQPDTGISQGSYMVSSPRGTIDGRVEAQEAAMRAALGAALGGNGA